MLTLTESWRNNGELSKAAAAFRAAVVWESIRDPKMRFSLKYEGRLKASRDGGESRVAEKNRLRWHFHNQLAVLMERGDFSRLPEYQKFQPDPNKPTFINFNALPDFQDFNGVVFEPLIHRNYRVACALRIRIDRNERPGAIFQRDGDLDNRMKTLFDALRMPRSENEALPDADRPNEKHCICLFEDDSMITSFAVETHASLEAIPKGHIKLNIDVEISAHDFVFDIDD